MLWLQETEKFKNHLLNKLSKKDIFGDSIEEVVGICTEVSLLAFALIWDINVSNSFVSHVYHLMGSIKNQTFADIFSFTDSDNKELVFPPFLKE